MTKHSKDNVYLLPNRLSDLIRLLVVLSVDKHSFRTEQGLTGILRDTPRSSKKWLELAKEHPEFFRFNKDFTSICLLLRFLQQVDVPDGELREPLSVDQTQKLVDQAIALHDKQLARYQRNGFRFPMYGAIAAAIVSLVVGLLNIYSLLSNNDKTDKKYEVITQKIDSLKSFQQNTAITIDTTKKPIRQNCHQH